MAEEKRLDVKERKPFLTSNQIGIAAAFGGAAFAFRALGYFGAPGTAACHGPRRTDALSGRYGGRTGGRSHCRYCQRNSIRHTNCGYLGSAHKRYLLGLYLEVCDS